MKKIISYLKLLLVIAIAFGIVIASNILLKVNNKENNDSLYAHIYPGITKSEDIELPEENKNIKSVKKVSNDDESIKGYIFDAVVTEGFGGDIEFQIAISEEGIIQGFNPIAHSETEGYGAAIDNKTYQEGFNGINATNGVKPGVDDKENGEIEAISGATITTQALVRGINNVIDAMSKLTDTVSAPDKELSYFSEAFDQLFINNPEIYTFEEFNKSEIFEDSVKRIVRVYRPGSKEGTIDLDSYLIYVSAQGFGGNIDYIIRTNKEFRVFGVVFANHNESENYGKYIDHEKYKESFEGLNLEKNFLTKAIKVRENPNGEKDILMISGATITSQSIQNSLNDVIETLVKFKKYYAEEENFDLISKSLIFSDNSALKAFKNSEK